MKLLLQISILLVLLIIMALAISKISVSKNTEQKNSDTLKFDIIEYDNNKQFYYSHDNSSEIISLDIAFRDAGYALDKKDKQGLSFVLLYLFRNSAVTSKPENLQNMIEQYGFKVDFNVDAENFYISVKSISQYKKQLLSLLQYFINPKITDNKLIEQAKENILQQYKINKGNAGFLASLEQNKTLFSDTSLANIPYGNKESMKSITIDDIQEFAKSRFTRENFYFAISGDASASDAKNIYKKLISDLAPKFKQKYNKYEGNYKPQKNHVNIDKDQVVIKAYMPSISKNSNNFYKYYIINYIFGASGLNSYLSTELREKHGLTYSAYSYFDIYNDFSIWNIEFSTDKKNYKKSLKILSDLINSIVKNGFTEDDLDKARKYLTGSYEIYFNSNEKISSYLIDSLVRGVSPSIIRSRNNLVSSYTIDEINNVLPKLLNFDDLSIITVGDID